MLMANISPLFLPHVCNIMLAIFNDVASPKAFLAIAVQDQDQTCAEVMVKEVRGMRARMERYSSKAASNEALDIASGT